jgi:hypothetical protein
VFDKRQFLFDTRRKPLNAAIAVSRLTAAPRSFADCGNRQVIDHTQGRSPMAGPIVKDKKHCESDCSESDHTQNDSQPIILIHQLPLTTRRLHPWTVPCNQGGTQTVKIQI